MQQGRFTVLCFDFFSALIPPNVEQGPTQKKREKRDEIPLLEFVLPACWPYRFQSFVPIGKSASQSPRLGVRRQVNVMKSNACVCTVSQENSLVASSQVLFTSELLQNNVSPQTQYFSSNPLFNFHVNIFLLL